MTSAITRFLAHVVRLPHSLGFGVQSPFAYQFVREVVRGGHDASRHDVRDGSDDDCHEVLRQLARQYPESCHRRQLHRFYFRLSRWCKAKVWSGNIEETVVEAYIRAGYAAAELESWKDGAGVYLLDLVDDEEESVLCRLYERVVSYASPSQVLVVEGIRRNHRNHQLWRMMVDDRRTVQTFDLFDCGVAFFDSTKSKMDYRVMPC